MSEKVLAAASRIVDLKGRLKITLGHDRLELEDALDDLLDEWTVDEFAFAYMALHRRVSDLEDFLKGAAKQFNSMAAPGASRESASVGEANTTTKELTDG